MKRNHTLHTFEALIATLLFSASPALAQDPGGVDTVFGSGSEPLTRAALTNGQGAGTITLPTLTEQGVLVGALQQEDGADRFIVQASLTSFLPGLSGEPAQFGGVYGKVLEVDSSGVTVENKALYVEGTWMVTDGRVGTLSASLVSSPDLGGPRLIGRIEGKFVFDETTGERPTLASPRWDRTPAKPNRPALEARVEGKRRGVYPPAPEGGPLLDVLQPKKRTSGIVSDAESTDGSGDAILTTNVFLEYALVAQ